MQNLTEQTLACFEQYTRDGARAFKYFVDEVQREHATVGADTGVLVLNSWFYGIASPREDDGTVAQVEERVRAVAQAYVTAVFQGVMPGARVEAFIRPGNLIVQVSPRPLSA